MEANLRATVVSISQVRTFTRQDGTEGRVTNLELRDESGSCRFALWDDDVGLVERGKVAVGTTVRALDCYAKRTNFGLDVSRGKFGALLVDAGGMRGRRTGCAYAHDVPTAVGFLGLAAV